MNFAPAPTFISTVVSLFRKRTPQPTFTPALPTVTTQVYITRDTTTHVDPPIFTNPFASQPSTLSEKQKEHPTLPLHCTSVLSEKHQHLYPETPRAPNYHRTTFALPVHDWNTAEFVGGQRYFDDDQASFCEVDLNIPPGHALVCHPTESGVYAIAEPETLARALFFFGFLFPAFWIAGLAILLMPLRTTTDWEAGRNSVEIEWGCSVIRATEIRWARRCLLALVSEVALILIVVVIVKWGVMAPV